MRRKLIDLKQLRSVELDRAETALKEGKREEYTAAMEKVRNMNSEIKSVQDLIDEQDRKFLEKADDHQVEKDKAGERGNALMKGEKVTFSVPEVRKALWGVNKSITLGTGTLVQPTGAGANIRDNLETTVSSIVDQVQVQDLTAGHTEQPGECTGGVLGFVFSSNCLVSQCGLYGCGTFGVTTKGVSNLEIKDSEIYDCTIGALSFSNSQSIAVDGCNIHDCPTPLLEVYDCTDITMDGKTVESIDF